MFIELTRSSGNLVLVHPQAIAWINEAKNGCVVTLHEKDKEGFPVKIFCNTDYDTVRNALVLYGTTSITIQSPTTPEALLDGVPF